MQLGERALKSIQTGQPIEDEILVQIITEKIKTINNSLGWILDGFPVTLNQLKLFEKYLTGLDLDKPNNNKEKKELLLFSNNNESQTKDFINRHKSGIDLIIYLEIEDDILIKRSIGRMSKIILYYYFCIIF